jgi:hypothetical protein
VRGKPQRIVERHCTAQHNFAMAKRDRRGVIPGHIGHVKDVVKDLNASHARGNAIGDLHAPLQPSEA